MVSELRSYGDLELADFLRESGLALANVLSQGRRSWTELRRAADLPASPGSALEPSLLKRVRAFAHVDDPDRHDWYRRLLAEDAPSYGAMSSQEQRIARMLYHSFWPGEDDVVGGLAALREELAVRSEVRQVIDLGFGGAEHVTWRLEGTLSHLPLRIHARYQREEILAALDFPRKPNSFREGVWYSQALNTDVFFVTLKKSEADYSPTTMYRDYPISPSLFHWESQSTTSLQSPTGQRYVNGTSTVLIFARQEQKDDFGTAPYLFLGPASYVNHEGERPIAITWELEHAMPTDFFTTAAAVAQ